jgi:hypothetical protein
MDIRTRHKNAVFTGTSIIISRKIRLLNSTSKRLGDYTMKVQKSTYKGKFKRILRHDTIKLTKTMKTSHIFGLTVLVLMVVAGALIASTFSHPTVSAQQFKAGISAQVTSTPALEDNSVIGSTDGILVMGVIIVIIIVTPLVFRRKRK